MTFKRSIYLLAIVVGVFLLDFYSKSYVHNYIPFMQGAFFDYPYGGVPVFQNVYGIEFSIIHVINKGAAWGMLAAWQTALHIARLAVIAGMIIYLCYSPKAVCKHFPLTLVIAGALGNVWDYFMYGHVIDMFHFKFGSYTFPVFNIADSVIFCGIVWLLLQSFQDKRRVIAGPFRQ